VGCIDGKGGEFNKKLRALASILENYRFLARFLKGLKEMKCQVANAIVKVALRSGALLRSIFSLKSFSGLCIFLKMALPVL